MSYKNEFTGNPFVKSESQVMRGMLDNVNGSPYFVDLRPFEDDKTVKKNPHKGWFWHYIDNGLRRPAYRDKNVPGDYLEDLPGLNHLYLRFDWCDIEKEKGVYDFSELDKIMEEWGPRGYTFSLRMCCFEGEKNLDFATPEYVFKDGARCFDMGVNGHQPDYSDPIFLERLEAAMEKLGEKYNKDPRIELVDIGTYGTWGEGHTVEGDSVIYPVETVKKHYQLHEKYFPDKYLIVNDDTIIGRMAHGSGEVNEMLQYAYARGFGVQDDSICCDGYSQDCGYDTMRARFAFEKLSENAPSVLEFAHYTYIRPNYDCHYRDGLTVIEAMKNAKTTFAGFHGYPRDWLPREHYIAEYAANRLGYWYFVPSALIPPLSPSAHNMIQITVKNKGWARAYWPVRVKLRVRGEGMEAVSDAGIDIQRLAENESMVINIPTDLRGFSKGKCSIGIRFECDGKFAAPALKDSILEDGFYTIGTSEII